MTNNQLATSRGHAFISYVRDDVERVDRLAKVLGDAGLQVWRDTNNIWPGQDWRAEIRKAINEDALAFLACFSTASHTREKSYQREELILACEQMRLRGLRRVWMIPIRFDECEVPDPLFKLEVMVARIVLDIHRTEEISQAQLSELISLEGIVHRFGLEYPEKLGALMQEIGPTRIASGWTKS